MAATSEPLTLEAGALEVGLVPQIGGSVSSLRWRGIDLMRRLSAEDREAGNVLGVAMFPMAPYANRIAGNAFEFGAKRWQVLPNNPPEKFNVHGSGWKHPWTVTKVGAADAKLSLEIVAGPEPYSYRAEQAFVASDDGLSVTITLTNTGPVAMPFGFGLHPWFDRDQDVTLQFKARRFYLEEPEGISGDPITRSTRTGLCRWPAFARRVAQQRLWRLGRRSDHFAFRRAASDCASRLIQSSST